MMGTAVPRIVVAGLSGDSGKTLVALALLLAARERGLSVRGFKKGPDFIDAAWLSWASRAPARNLDTFLTTPDGAARTFARHAARQPAGPIAALNVIEGNRGLFDGTDAEGTHSTAALAKLLGAPVVLVINARKMTATAAALVRGCQATDPGLSLAGVVLNQVAGRRHADVAREAIERACGVPVLGVIPRVDEPDLLPGRHLGLVPPAEHSRIGGAAEALRQIAREHLDVDRLLACAGGSPSGVVDEPPQDGGRAPRAPSERVTIGYVSDPAFSFYYPENLEALEARGATLVPLSSLAGSSLPPGLSALYIGGGFPEAHAAAIAENRAFLGSLRASARGGLPIFAECGGLMLLANAFSWQGRRYPMAGVIPVDVEVMDAPQGHGYLVLSVDRANPFFQVGLELRAHEFHYSRIVGPPPDTVCGVLRGTGCGGGRDAIVVDQVWASYAHLHAAGAPAWADGMIRAARGYRAKAGDPT
jgi:cobyrinic acid a,c-diamide synthase